MTSNEGTRRYSRIAGHLNSETDTAIAVAASFSGAVGAAAAVAVAAAVDGAAAAAAAVVAAVAAAGVYGTCIALGSVDLVKGGLVRRLYPKTGRMSVQRTECMEFGEVVQGLYYCFAVW